MQKKPICFCNKKVGSIHFRLGMLLYSVISKPIRCHKGTHSWYQIPFECQQKQHKTILFFIRPIQAMSTKIFIQVMIVWVLL